MRDELRDLIEDLLDEFIEESDKILNIEKEITLKNSKQDGTNSLLDFMTKEDILNYAMKKLDYHIDELEEASEELEEECVEPLTISTIDAGVTELNINSLIANGNTPSVVYEGTGDVWIECNACNNPIITLKELLSDIGERVEIEYGDSLSADNVLEQLRNN